MHDFVLPLNCENAKPKHGSWLTSRQRILVSAFLEPIINACILFFLCCDETKSSFFHCATKKLRSPWLLLMVVTLIWSIFFFFSSSLISATWALYGDRITILCCLILALTNFSAMPICKTTNSHGWTHQSDLHADCQINGLLWGQFTPKTKQAASCSVLKLWCSEITRVGPLAHCKKWGASCF